MRCARVLAWKARPHHAAQIAELLDNRTFNTRGLRYGKRKSDLPAFKHRGTVDCRNGCEVKGRNRGYGIGCAVATAPGRNEDRP